MAERNKDGVLMHHSYHLSFNANDPFELAIYRALKTMPRGYGKLFFLRMASMVFQDERSTKRLARMMFDFGRDVRPTSVRMLSKLDYKEGDPSTMLTYYPPSVEMEMPSQYFRSNGREETRLKLKAIELMEQDRKTLMKRLIKPSEAIDAVLQDEMYKAQQAARNGLPCPDQRTFEEGYSKYSPTAAVGKPGLSRQRTPREETVEQEMQQHIAGLDEAVQDTGDALARALAKARAEDQQRRQVAADKAAREAQIAAEVAEAAARAAAKAAPPPAPPPPAEEPEAAVRPGYSRHGNKMGRPRKNQPVASVVSIEAAKKPSSVLKKLCWGG